MNLYPELEGVRLSGKRPMFEKEAIERNARRGIDPALLERSLHCLEYVAQLSIAGLDFVFKGGTACQLLIPGGLQRLSIDIDIATDAPEREIRDALRSITERAGGRTYIPADVPKKGMDGVPLLMFNISAPTYYPGQKPDTMIKLDAMLKAPAYATTRLPLRTFYYESDAKAVVPTVSSMLGDKLSSLGPDTIGIPFDRAVDNVKQFYDVGSLLGTGFRLGEVRKAYLECFRDQVGWRGLSISAEDALLDLAEWCKVASAMQFVPEGTNAGQRVRIRTLSRGVDGFAGYIAKENVLTKRRMREVASRAALLARLLRDNSKESALLDFIRTPEAFSKRVVEGFDAIAGALRKVPVAEMWHIHPAEFRNNPLAMAAWCGYWFPEELARLLA